MEKKLSLIKQIPAGYKQTEIGVIPEDWNVKKLGDIGYSIIGLTYSPSEVSYFGKLVHRSSNIQNNQLSYNDNVYVNKRINEKLILKENDILICVRNGSRDLIGKSALIKGESVGETFGAFMTVFRSDKFQPFIFYLILSNLIQRQINQSLGATINQITNKTLNNFQIPFPPKPEEQTAIATVLSDTDALIENLEKLIAKKKAIKQGAMQQLLTGKKRLQGFSGEWEVKKLGEVIYLQGGYAFKSQFFTEIGVSIIRISDVGNDKVDTNNSVCYKPFNIPKDFIAVKGDILIAMSGATTGKIGVYQEDKLAYINQRVGKFVILNQEKTALQFVSHIVRSEKFKEKLQKEIAQGAQPNISGKQIESILLSIPPTKSEQIAIATILSDMDAEIESLEQKRDKYTMLKQGMMQQLLTGRIRIYANN